MTVNSNDLFDQISFDDHAAVVADGRQQYRHAIRAFDVVLKHSDEFLQRSPIDHHRITFVQIVTQLDEPVFTHSQLNELDNLVINARWTITKVDNTVNAARETNTPKRLGNLKLCEKTNPLSITTPRIFRVVGDARSQ